MVFLEYSKLCTQEVVLRIKPGLTTIQGKCLNLSTISSVYPFSDFPGQVAGIFASLDGIGPSSRTFIVVFIYYLNKC